MPATHLRARDPAMSVLTAEESPKLRSGTPPWLLARGTAPCECCRIGRRSRASFVDKTIGGTAGVFRQAMFGADMAARDGLLQRLDPRVKLAGLMALLLTTGFLHHIEVLLAVYGLTLVLAWSSGLPMGFFIRRVWLTIPLFTGIVVLPATLSIVTPGDVVLNLWSWHGSSQGFTAQGLTSAGLVMTRVATSVSLVLLTTLTTPWPRLLAALRSLGVPRMFVLIIGMAYRYIFALLDTITDMYESRKARTLGRVPHDRRARAFVSSAVGAVFGQAQHLSEDVHQAMVSRGYRGDATTLQAFRLRALDLAAGVVVVASALLIYGSDVALGR